MAKITRSIKVTVVEARTGNGEVQTHEFYGVIPNKKAIEKTFNAIFGESESYTTTMKLETRKYEMSMDDFMAAAHVVNENEETEA